MWKRFLSFYDWLARIDFARNAAELLLGQGIWTKIGVAAAAVIAAVYGWLSSPGLPGWERTAIVLGLAILVLVAAHLLLLLLAKMRARVPPAEPIVPLEPPFLMTLAELFAHIHPLPFAGDADRNAVGQDVIDHIASGQIGVYGRRIEGTKRLALEPIPYQVWARAKFSYWFLDSQQDRDTMHVECPREERGSLPRYYADVRVIREQALDIWSYIPLKEAARLAYERTRDSVLSKAAERFGDGPSGTLQYIAGSIYLYHPVYGEKPPSTVREAIPDNLRPSTHVSDDCDSILEFSEKNPRYIHPTVSRADLDAFIEWAKSTTMNQEAPT